jgi:2-phosphoglycerate kinase
MRRVKEITNKNTTKDRFNNLQETKKRTRPREKYLKYNAQIEMEKKDILKAGIR